MNKGKVFLALSGGVDSAVAAAELLEAGYEVQAVFLKIWSDQEEKSGQCPWVQDRLDALSVAAKLNIPLQTVDFEQQYRRDVFSYFIDEYKNGRTPNPDILCNAVIKFGSFLEYALEHGADFIATGHHVRRSPKEGRDKHEVYHLLSGIDELKDQSYFLAALNQHQLSHSLFPIGHLTKEQVRERAKALGLDKVADKRSTRGICFIGKVDLRAFLSKYQQANPGHVLDVKTKAVIGHHQGVHFYTIGQRHGFEITVKKPDDGPHYIVSKHVDTNELIVTNDPKDPDLFSRELVVADIHWLDGKLRQLPLKCQARIRYHQALQACEIVANVPELSDMKGQSFNVIFAVPQKAAAPGQVVAFYDGVELLGSAVIA